MKHLSILFSIAITSGALLPVSAENVDLLQTQAAKVFAERQDCTVKLAVTRKVKGKDQSFEIPAVSLDGKGLLVASLHGIESNARGMLSILQMQGGGGDDGDDESTPGKPKAADKGELTRVALLCADATEAEGTLVLTDTALDLALIRVRPTEGKEPSKMPVPPAAKDAPVLLENVVSIERQGPQFQRVASVGLLQIAALVTTPRSFYIPSPQVAGGTAVYNLRGELLGVVTRVHDECVIVPTAAILKVAATIPADKSP